MSFGKAELERDLQEANVVSILVLMDVVREALPGDDRIEQSSRFNPCSNGCRSGSRHAEPKQAEKILVSILVLMDVVREETSGIRFWNFWTAFQSLF